MSTKDDGGLVFPVTFEQLECDAIGMTRRQLYAGMIAAGDWAAQDQSLGFFRNDDPTQALHGRARLYWRMADALLATETEEVEP